MNTPDSIKRISGTYQRFQRLGLAAQFALLMLACLPPVWILVGYELEQLRATAEFESHRDIDNMARAFSEEINSSVSTIDLSLIALRPHWVRNRAEFREIVAQHQKMIEDQIIFQVAVTDAQGIMQFSNVDPNAKALDLSDREHVRVHREGNRDVLFVSKPVLGRVSNKWSIQFTRPIYSTAGKFEGVIIASVAPSYFSRFYDGIDLGANSAIALTRSDGTILARSPFIEGRAMGTVLTGIPFDSKSEPVGFYRRASQVDGVERNYAWRSLPRYGLTVIVGQSLADAYARIGMQRSVYIQGGIIISAAIAVLGLAMLRSSRARYRALQALAEAESRWKFALEGSGDGVWDWNCRTNRAALSRQARSILQVEDEELDCSQEALSARVHPDDIMLVNKNLQDHFDGKTPTYVVEHRVRGRNGGWIWILARGMLVQRNPDGTPRRMVGTFADITERKAREENANYLAQHDPLTGLPNRALFADRLRQAILRAQREESRVAVIYFDLDKFKPVNDTFGHALGDSLLQAVAERVRQCLRESDTLARVGGDEFVVLLPRVTAESDAVTVAANILAALNTPFDVEGHRLEISGSLGVATYPTDGRDVDRLLRCADRAMYQAKNAGRNRVHVYDAKKDVDSGMMREAAT